MIEISKARGGNLENSELIGKLIPLKADKDGGMTENLEALYIQLSKENIPTCVKRNHQSFKVPLCEYIPLYKGDSVYLLGVDYPIIAF